MRWSANAKLEQESDRDEDTAEGTLERRKINRGMMGDKLRLSRIGELAGLASTGRAGLPAAMSLPMRTAAPTLATCDPSARGQRTRAAEIRE
jgi:hypothetical protein